MASRGYDPIGIDGSLAMLNQARQKLEDQPAQGASCLFLKQDISNFELFGTVDLIVSLLDTVNHLLKKTELRRMLKLCANYLNPGGLLIFDLLRLDYMQEKLGNNCFFFDEPDFSLIWQNSFQKSRGTSTAALTLFQRLPQGYFQKQQEIVRERYYSKKDIQAAIAGTSLQLAGRHAASGLAGVSPGSRDIYVLRQLAE